MKYGKFTSRQIEEVIEIIGEDNIERLLSGDISIKFEDIKKPFDKNGYRFTALGLNVCNPDKNYKVEQPELETEADYDNRLDLLYESCHKNFGITGKQLKKRTEEILASIRKDSQNYNLANGPYLPILLDQYEGDIGTWMKKKLLAVEKSYGRTFPGRDFYDCEEGKLVNQIFVVEGSRQEQLINMMEKGPVMGIYFPTALQGYSINAARKQIVTLPSNIILSGLDTIMAMIMYPDILAKSWYTTKTNLAGLQCGFLWEFRYCSFIFESYDDFFSFKDTKEMSFAESNFSSGLLVLSNDIL